MSGSPLTNKTLKTDDVSAMKVPGENGEEVRIIAQSQFDVNHENIKIEGTDLVDSNMGSKTVFSRRTSKLAQRARLGVWFETFHASDYFLFCRSLATSMNEFLPPDRFVSGLCR